MRHPCAILSETVGVPESSLRLLLTILLAYPVAACYQSLFYSNSRKAKEDEKEKIKQQFTKAFETRNTYVLVSGLAMSTFFNGWAVYHSLLTLIVSYFLCLVFQYQRTVAVAGVWIFNAAYLLGGYYVMAADDYDISWTMTQCILCLRLLGFSMDFMDGGIKTNITAITAENKKVQTSRPLSFGANTALTTLPSLSQVAAYCFFPSSFLVGPQFSFSLYQEWLQFYEPHPSSKSKQRQRYAFKCAIWGIFYLVLQQLIGVHYPTTYLLTDDYAGLPLLRRCGIFWLVGKFVFTKYLGVWLLTEGATALFGIGYEGQLPNGQYSFAGLANVDPIKYETATSIEHIIGSFNINTNYWSKYHVFKRLRWMGSKTGSQMGTLAFLAIWHGFHYGYFTTFLMEFLDVMAEGILRKWIALLFPTWSNTPSSIKTILAWCLCSSTLFYAGVGFDLLSLTSSWVAYRQVYFIGHILLASLLVSSLFLPSRIKKD
ncbi:MBOAT, membrane-bound O-acyltransferase family-domain-containing protein [Halteromyces radiatus]|uniref:MBOAT, membrane-bound O-acyltransferase family-domain-containing protein n=1 Tax=Halteromyces radiatus TaxID=101107 RepID=UPI00221FF363|nr:MBOAT, membrane-bound O-acyltransferase family-domain-containing protein [Halteromyces radiatus]KAI8092631.1 MBOAT, membrane-bound O-acyltransferase family-domain-containing protein [Halteromyces radiatus]